MRCWFHNDFNAIPYKSLNNSCPEYMSGIFKDLKVCAISLLDQSENALMVPKPNYDFPLSQAKIWNSLPLEAQSEAKNIPI